jgi:predicted Fe-Mo cluster-binding NifX family protein
MGGRALGLFTRHGIEVVIGVSEASPETIIKDYLAGTLEAGPNICDH